MNNKNQLTLAQHFHELKKRVIACFAFFIAVFCFCYYNATAITKWFIQIGKDAGFAVGYVTPQEMLIQSLRLCGTLALVASLPLIIWNVLAFIMPAISSQRVHKLIIIGVLVFISLFALGIVFCIKILFPFVFKYLYSYSKGFGVTGYATVSSFLSLFLTTAWITGFLFEVPLFSALLSLAGVLKHTTMQKGLKPAIVVIAIIAAIITPPDVVSMMIVGIPMIAIYVFSIGVSFVCERKKHTKTSSE